MAMATGDNNLILAPITDVRKASVFVGGNSDDGVAINAFSASRNTANDTAGTVSAWINMPDIAGTYTIWSVHDAGIAEYIHFSVENGKLFAVCTKATTIQWDINSTDVVITAHKWHHVAIVQDGVTPKFYVDGVEVAVTTTTTTDLTEWFELLIGLDEGWIGTVELTAATLTQEFKGGISDVKYWAVALTSAQITMDHDGRVPDSITGTSGDLTNWWDMDDDLVDSVAGEDGTIVGDVFLSNGYGALASRLKLAGLVVADDITMVAHGNVAVGALMVKA